jgi:hypothetical protein
LWKQKSIPEADAYIDMAEVSCVENLISASPDLTTPTSWSIEMPEAWHENAKDTDNLLVNGDNYKQPSLI